MAEAGSLSFTVGRTPAPFTPPEQWVAEAEAQVTYARDELARAVASGAGTEALAAALLAVAGTESAADTLRDLAATLTA